VTIDPSSHIPIYQQIVEHVCGSVAAGVYRAGEALPSIRALASEMLVNPNTVQRAYQELERSGVIRTRKGLGVFVAENGNPSAHHQAEAAMSERFCEGIRLGRQTGMPASRIGAIFRGAMNQTGNSPAKNRD
jgi:GntR family transcriptional regulator